MAPIVPTYRSEAFAEDITDDPAYTAAAPGHGQRGGAWLGTLVTLGAGLAAVVAWLGLGQPAA